MDITKSKKNPRRKRINCLLHHCENPPPAEYNKTKLINDMHSKTTMNAPGISASCFLRKKGAMRAKMPEIPLSLFI
ncbi:MAG: hypothetical protein LBF84_02560 [Holosporales bacterium]|jgi:hypothetical protein|nr:hypothetical protein [Holosporales bacterium]